MDRGYKLEPSEKMLQARINYQNANDSLKGFVEECCELHPASRTKTSHFNRLYEFWCKSQKYNVEKLGSRRPSLMKHFGIKPIKTDGGHECFPLTIKNDKIRELVDMFSSLKQIEQELFGNQNKGDKGKKGSDKGS